MLIADNAAGTSVITVLSNAIANSTFADGPSLATPRGRRAF
jgi:hypothetical protein